MRGTKVWQILGNKKGPRGSFFIFDMGRKPLVEKF
jgi:hypothetical protein